MTFWRIRLPMGSPLWPCIFLAVIDICRLKDNAVSTLTSWGHARDGPLSMGGSLWPCIYLAPLWRYEASNVGRTHAWMDGWTLRWFYTLSNVIALHWTDNYTLHSSVAYNMLQMLQSFSVNVLFVFYCSILTSQSYSKMLKWILVRFLKVWGMMRITVGDILVGMSIEYLMSGKTSL